MSLIYETDEWKGYGNKEYYHNEYRREGDTVYKYKCRRAKFFDGHENNWDKSARKVDSWDIDDSEMPKWLRKYL